MAKDINVMVTSAGAGPAVAVIKALKRQNKLRVRIHAIDANPFSAGFYLSDTYNVVPHANDPNFIPEVLKICLNRKIDFIIPIFDTETPVFARDKNEFETKSIQVLVNDLEVIKICNNKLKTYEHCLTHGILVPQVFTTDDIQNNRINYPVIAKPVQGIGSQDMILIRDAEEMHFWQQRIQPEILYQQFVNGLEYTVDTLSDLNGNFLAAVPRERIVVKAGQTVKGKVIGKPEFIEYSQKVVEKFKIKGVGCFQFKQWKGEKYFIEMNPRYGTGISLSVGAGINMPLLHLNLALGKKISDKELIFEDGCIMVRYWEEIFLGKNVSLSEKEILTTRKA